VTAEIEDNYRISEMITAFIGDSISLFWLTALMQANFKPVFIAVVSRETVQCREKVGPWLQGMCSYPCLDRYLTSCLAVGLTNSAVACVTCITLSQGPGRYTPKVSLS
jgi:hypothetical protein